VCVACVMCECGARVVWFVCVSCVCSVCDVCLWVCVCVCVCVCVFLCKIHIFLLQSKPYLGH